MKNTKVEVETAAVEAPKSNEVEATKTVRTPVDARQYILKSEASVPGKGVQRIAVLSVLRNANGKPMTAAEIEPKAVAAGLKAVGGTLPSVKYHLHQLQLLGFVEVVNLEQTVAA